MGGSLWCRMTTMYTLPLLLALLIATPGLAADREIWLRGQDDLVYVQEEGKVHVQDRDGRKGFTKVARTKWPTVSQEALRKERLRSWDAHPRPSHRGVVLYTSYPSRSYYRYGPAPYRSYRYARPYRSYRHGGYARHGYGHYRSYGHRGRHYSHRGGHHGRPHVSHHRGSRGGDIGRRGYSREMLGHRGRRR